MRALFIIVISAALGAFLGTGMTKARLGSDTSADAMGPFESPSLTPATAGATAPKVTVDEVEFDFGAIENDSIVSHTFDFKNIGKSPLTLKAGGTTCQKCTIAEISQPSVAPGATVGVTIQYTAAAPAPMFRQSATILTDDPDRPRVELTVSGSITPILNVDPPQLVFSKLSVHDTHTLQARLYNHVSDELQILGYQWSDKSTEPFLRVETASLEAAVLEKAKAKSGQLVSVTVLPGLPLGLLQQKLTLETDLATRPKVVLEVLATISSDISLAGAGWNEDNSYLHIGPVPSQMGAKRSLRLFVRGPYRNDVEIKLGDVTPEFIKVSIGEKTTINDGLIVQFPVSIEIPKGSPSVNYLSSKLGGLAKVTLETTHPEARQINVPIRFAVEEE
jgi:hypothetical protein